MSFASLRSAYRRGWTKVRKCHRFKFTVRKSVVTHCFRRGIVVGSVHCVGNYTRGGSKKNKVGEKRHETSRKPCPECRFVAMQPFSLLEPLLWQSAAFITLSARHRRLATPLVLPPARKRLALTSIYFLVSFFLLIPRDPPPPRHFLNDGNIKLGFINNECPFPPFLHLNFPVRLPDQAVFAICKLKTCRKRSVCGAGPLHRYTERLKWGLFIQKHRRP